MGNAQNRGEGSRIPREDLRDAEEGGLYNPESENGEGEGGESGGANKSGDRESGRGKAASPGRLRNSEESAGNKNKDSDNDGLYNPDEDQGRLAPLRKARHKVQDVKSRAFKNKWLVGIAIGSNAVVIGMIILLAVIIGGYKVVDFAEHVAAYQFARNTASMAEDTATINAEKLGIDSLAAESEDAAASATDRSLAGQLLDKVQAKATAASGKAKDLWANLDKYRPAKTIANFKNNGTLTLNEGTTRLGRTYVKSATIKNETASLTTDLETRSLRTSIKNSVIPGYKFATRDFSFSRNFAPDLIQALEANNIGPITRARIASQIRSELNIGLVAWIAGRYAGKDDTQEKVNIEQDAYNTAEEGSASSISTNGSTTSTSTGSTGGSTNKTIDDVAQQAKAAENAEVSDATQVKNNILPNTNSLPDSVQTAMASIKDSALNLGGVLSGIVGFINPFYKIAVPLCLVYDGSLSAPDSGQTIDMQNTQMQRSALWIQSASAQLKDGNTANGEVDGALDYKLGDITSSFPEERASGIPVNTSSFPPSEASPTGQFSLATGLPAPIDGIVTSLGSACPALTNLWVGAALGGANIAISAVVGYLTGGEGDIAIAGGESAAETAADQAVPSLASRTLSKIVNGGSKLKDFGVQTGKQVALIGGATLIAKAIVASKIGASHNSLSTGQPYDDTLDCGTNLYANEIERVQFYGAPLTDQNLAADNASNVAQLTYEESQQSAVERYASVNNPNSLISRVAMASSGYFSSSVWSIPLKIGNALLNPIRSIGSILSPLMSHSAFAAATVTSANTYCGNVQFGFTPYEKQLIANDPSYKPIENQEDLDASGQESAIAARYGPCFDPKVSMGTLLTQKAPDGEYYIVRENDGNVNPDKGLCAPRNLGTNNIDSAGPPEAASSSGHGWADLVFRWRVAQAYNNTLDQLSQEQTVSNTTPVSATTTSSSGSLPSGTSQALAQQLLPLISSGKIKCGSAAGGNGPADCLDIQNTAKGVPIGGNCGVDALTPHLLGLILGLVQTDGWTLGLSAICSNHHSEGCDAYSGHTCGQSADFSIQNGNSGAAAASDEKFVNDAAALLSSTGGSFGQIECHPPYAVLAGSKFTTFDDSCTHQHIRAAP